MARCSVFVNVRLLLLEFSVLVTTSVRDVDTTSIVDVQDQIDEFIRQTMSTAGTPGVSLAIVNGEEMFSRGYGVRRLDSPGNVTEDTLFLLGSTTKAFTTTTLLQTLTDNNLTLTSKVRDVLTDFYLAEYYRHEQATMTDLLAHRLGIPESNLNSLLGAVTTREDAVRRALYFKPTEQFRDALVYSNLFYTAAGLVVQQLHGGELWEDVVRERIFFPLGMTGTSFMDQLTPEQLAILATPYEPDRQNNDTMREILLEFYKHIGARGPAGSIVSSARDLSKWLYMLTHGGVNHLGERVIDESVITNTMTPHSVAWVPDVTNQPLTTIAENYGLGWIVGFYNGYRMANHGGSIFGYQTMASVFPALKLGIFTCINGELSNTSTQQLYHNFITDLLMPAQNSSGSRKTKIAAPLTRPPPEDAYQRQLMRNMNNDAIAARHPSTPTEQRRQGRTGERRQSSRRTRKALIEYEGTYGNFAFGNATVRLNPTTNRLQVEYGDLLVADVVHVSDEVFLGRPKDPLWFFPSFQMTFARRSSDNVVVNVTVPFLLTSDSPVFVRGLTMDQAPPPPTCDC